MRYLTILYLAALLAGCATAPPFDMSGADPKLTPNRAGVNIEAARGQRAAWGGVVINTRNLKDATEIEVLGYPLDSSGRPDTGASPQRRFLLVRDGYLESADYRNGRLISAVGAITGAREGKVGEAPYVYPVLRADQLYLWPIADQRRTDPRIHFGVGVGVIFR